ncbi:MAG: type II toxin-antitoxin system HicB family antitoxin [Pleurocapsa sp. SU_196_0]|nr:type II toxin-antitoxin system HicB family antitoxin [Pleurocapsa sp. SU_196_0]
MTFKIIVHNADEGGFWAEVPSLPGCLSQGETLEELQMNIRDAIEAWLWVDETQFPTQNTRILEVAV